MTKKKTQTRLRLPDNAHWCAYCGRPSMYIGHNGGVRMLCTMRDGSVKGVTLCPSCANLVACCGNCAAFLATKDDRGRCESESVTGPVSRASRCLHWFQDDLMDAVTIEARLRGEEL